MLKNNSSFTKKEIIYAFWKLNFKLWLIILLGAVGFIYVGYGIYSIINNDYDYIFLFGGIGFITISISLAIIPYVIASKANKNASSIDYELEFYDSYFNIVIKKELERQESSIDYKDIYRIIKKGNIFYIYLNKTQAVLLKLDSFNQNDKLEFLKLMEGIR